MKISLKDGKMMFEGCILLLDGEPVFVRLLTEQQAGVYTPKLGAKQTIMDHRSYEAFSPISSRLGYLNNPDLKAAFFLSRDPVRQFKVGICANNLAVIGRKDLVRGFVDAFPYWTGLVDCLNGVYPTLKEVAEKLGSGWKGVAFDKQFSVDDNMDVLYKGKKKVGKFNPENLKIRWKGGYEVLGSVVTNV